MQRKFILNLVLLLLLNFLVKPFYIIGIDAEILDRVGESAYGNYFAILAFTILFNIILDLGIVNFNIRNLARHSQLIKKQFSGIFTLRLLLILPYTACCFLGAYFLDYDLTGILPWLIFNQIIIASKKINSFGVIAPTLDDVKYPNYKLDYTKDQKFDPINPFKVKSVDGYSMLLNLKKLKQLSNFSFFDENIFLYLENDDFCKRLQLINENIFVVPKSKVGAITLKEFIIFEALII